MKRIKKIKWSLLAVFIWLASVLPSHSETAKVKPRNGDIWAQVGLWGSRVNPAIENLAQDPFRFSPGVFVFGQITPFNFLEFALYADFEKYLQKDQGSKWVQGINRLSFSTGYLRELSKKYSLGLALVSAYSMGEIVSSSPVPSSIDTGAGSSVKHGINLSFDLHPFDLTDKTPGLRLIYTRYFSNPTQNKAEQLGIFCYVNFLTQRGLTKAQKEKLRQIRLKKTKSKH